MKAKKKNSKKSGGVRNAQNGSPSLTLGRTSPDWRATGPGLRIDGQTYQNSQLTGATRVPINPETGDQLPIMLPAAEVVGRRDYEDSIAEAVSRTNSGLLGSQTSAQDYAQMENAVRSRMNTAGNNMLAAAGDVLSSPQRYAVNAPLAYAMGKTPNLRMFPSADRNLGIDQPNAFPSETLGVNNPIGAFAVDALTDPTAIAAIGALGLAGISRAGVSFKNAYRLNPFANKLNNPNAFYRIAGRDAFEDAMASGVVRGKQRGKIAAAGKSGRSISDLIGDRPTWFPSFAKGSPEFFYRKNADDVIFQNSGPMYRRGDMLPTGRRLASRHYAYRPWSPVTQKFISEIPVEQIFEATPHWLMGHRQLYKNGGVLKYQSNMTR